MSTNAIEKDLFGNPTNKTQDDVHLNKKKKPSNKKDLSQTIQTRYVIEIECKDENEQRKMFEALDKKGFNCQILTL